MSATTEIRRLARLGPDSAGHKAEEEKPPDRSGCGGDPGDLRDSPPCARGAPKHIKRSAFLGVPSRLRDFVVCQAELQGSKISKNLQADRSIFETGFTVRPVSHSETPVTFCHALWDTSSSNPGPQPCPSTARNLLDHCQPVRDEMDQTMREPGIYLYEDVYLGPFASMDDAKRFLQLMELLGDRVECIQIVELKPTAKPGCGVDDHENTDARKKDYALYA